MPKNSVVIVSDNPNNLPKAVNWAVGKTHNVILISFNQLEIKSLIWGENNKPIDIVIIDVGGNNKETVRSIIGKMNANQLVVLVHHNSKFAEDIFGFCCGGGGQPKGMHCLSALSGFEIGLVQITRRWLSRAESSPKRLPGRNIFASV